MQAAAAHSETARRELEGPDLPEEIAYVWHWFCELDAARERQHSSVVTPGAVVNTNAISPIGYAEIWAWTRLTGRWLKPWQTALLRELDLVWLAGPPKDGGDHGDRGHGSS
jgi:hypothetical protein